MRSLFISLLFLAYLYTNAQISEPLANNVSYTETNKPDTITKSFSNSEPRGITFKVSTDQKKQKLSVRTNYTGKYKVLFIDYYAGSRKVFKNVYNNLEIDMEDLKGEIFIMNISDSENKLLTSQILNLRLRNY